LDNLASVNINGTRAAQNNWLIDGADNVDTGSNLGVINFISVDAVSEFRILRGNYSAEFGRSGGGQVNVLTRGGTNGFHGSAYEFFRNDALDSRNFFSYTDRHPEKCQNPKTDRCSDPALLRYNNFGWNIGGPILKDKLFFFYGHELREVRTVRGGGVNNTRVPTQLQKQGDFSEFPSVVIKDPLTGQQFSYQGKLNVIPPDRINSNAKALLDAFPAPNSSPALLGGQRNYSAMAPSGRNYREYLIRVDYNMTEKHRFYGRWVHDKIPSEEPFGEIFGTNYAAFPGISNTKTNIPARGLVVEWNYIVSPRIVNNAAFNYSRGGIFSEITGKGLKKNFSGFTSAEVYPDVNPGGVIPGVAFGGAGGYGGFDFFGPYDNSYGSYRWKENLSWVIGGHSLKMGYLYSHEFKNENAASGTNGAYSFPGTTSSTFTSAGDAFADFLLGRANSYSETNIDITSHLRYDMHEAYFQDDWKFRPNLTINLGVRWSYILPPIDLDDVLSNFDPTRFDPARAYQIASNNTRVPGTGDPLNGMYLAGEDSPYGRRIVASHADTFGPRFGFAWDPMNNGKSVIRGGYGIYFDRTLVGIALQNAFVNPPFAVSALYSAAGAAGTPTLTDPRGGAPRNNETIVASLISMSPDFLVPTTQHWSLGYQRQLPWDLTMDIAYAGNHGTHLLRAVRINQTLPGTVAPTAASANFRGWGTITERQTSASSRYDSLQLSVSKRYAQGLQFGLAYTWSKVMTDSPDDRSTLPQDLRNLKAERARASFDKTHIFVTSFVYELPFFKSGSRLMQNTLGGWQIGGIVRAESGTPWNVAISPNQANVYYGGTQRPNLIGDPWTDAPQTREKWFNTEAFELSALNTFGNAGRMLIPGPGIYLWDLSIYKNFTVTERVKMQFRGEMFNAFNHTNFYGVGTTFASATYGQITSALEPRQVQFGLRLAF
jgi:hypothetical protein